MGNKFNARKVWLDDYCFDSQKEAKRYVELVALKMIGEVASVDVHPVYELTVEGQRIGKMTPDFYVVWASGEVVVEDVKGGRATRTEAYRLRRKVFEACHWPLTITEV